MLQKGKVNDGQNGNKRHIFARNRAEIIFIFLMVAVIALNRLQYSKKILQKEQIENLEQRSTSITVKGRILSSHDNQSPILVLHAGIHKTATSTIQCELSRYSEDLYRNASVAYLARYYFGPCESSVKPSSRPKFNEIRELIDDCLPKASCDEKVVWKKFELILKKVSNKGKSVVISDEAFSRMPIYSDDNIDNRFRLYKLFSKYYPGRVHVVVVYRRYFEWLLSFWNEHSKPYNNWGDGKYLPSFQKWPSEGGRTSKSFQDYLSYISSGKSSKKSSKNNNYLISSFDNDIHPSEYVRRLWTNYSNHSFLLNMHEMMDNNDGEDIGTRFVRKILPPNAAETLIAAKERDTHFSPRSNPSRNLDYDRLVLKAHERGLLSKNASREEIGLLTEKNLLKKLNTTIDNLPLTCVKKSQLLNLLEVSLKYEQQLFPDQPKEATIQHSSAFHEASKKKKFCNLDTDKIIEDPLVQEFFKTL